jgi:hypothetical protein
MANETSPCPYCLSPLAAGAKKCKYCREYLDSTVGHKTQSPNWLQVYRTTATAFAKIALPLAILIAVLVFRPDLSGLLGRASSAKYGQFEILFDVPSVFQRTLALHPLSFLYLLEAAKSRGTFHYNYDHLAESEKERINALQDKGLAVITIKDNEFTDPAKQKIFGKTSLTIEPTPKGYEFIRSISLGEIIGTTVGTKVPSPQSTTTQAH